MKTIQLLGKVDALHHLSAEVPKTIPPGDVKVLLVLPDQSDEVTEQEWMRFIAENWKAELSDPREDIYTLHDGEPVDGAR